MSETKQEISVICWNVENFFHPESGGPRFDMTPSEGWTLEKYEAKCKRLGEAINTIFSQESSLNTPCILGLTEVENARVISDLCAHIQKPLALATSPDAENLYLDSVVLYDPHFFNLKACTYHNTFERFPRGEFARIELELKANGEIITVFCCHLKARPSNKYFTEMYREATSDNIQAQIWCMHGGDQVRAQINRMKDSPEEKPKELILDKNIIVMGDFNDDPFSTSIMDYLSASHDMNFVLRQKQVDKVALYNCSWEKLQSEKPGSHYYNFSERTQWTMLDQIIVSPALLKDNNPLQYVKKSFEVIDSVSADENGFPLRICTKDAEDNLVWQDGYSDHFPVRIKLRY